MPISILGRYGVNKVHRSSDRYSTGGPCTGKDILYAGLSSMTKSKLVPSSFWNDWDLSTLFLFTAQANFSVKLICR